jgi:hypothetical protein
MSVIAIFRQLANVSANNKFWKMLFKGVVAFNARIPPPR